MSRCFSRHGGMGGLSRAEMMATKWRRAVHRLQFNEDGLCRRLWPTLGALAVLIGLSSGRSEAQEAKQPQVLKIGSSGSSALDAGGVNKQSAIATLEDFIKTETGLENKIIEQKSW